jgi:hypothetical protein
MLFQWNVYRKDLDSGKEILVDKVIAVSPQEAERLAVRDVPHYNCMDYSLVRFKRV